MIVIDLRFVLQQFVFVIIFSNGRKMITFKL